MRQAGAGVGRMVGCRRSSRRRRRSTANRIRRQPTGPSQLVAAESTSSAPLAAIRRRARHRGSTTTTTSATRSATAAISGRRRRRDVAVDQDGVEAGVAAEPLDRRRPADAVVDREARGARCRGDCEEAEDRSAHGIRRQEKGMNHSVSALPADRRASRRDREMSPHPTSARASIRAHCDARRLLVRPGKTKGPQRFRLCQPAQRRRRDTRNTGHGHEADRTRPAERNPEHA